MTQASGMRQGGSINKTEQCQKKIHDDEKEEEIAVNVGDKVVRTPTPVEQQHRLSAIAIPPFILWFVYT